MKKLVTLLLAAAMLLTVCAMASAEKITVAYHPHITGVGGLLNAIDNGYFDEEGLEVELVQFTSGATELAAMASGQINIGYLGVGAHVFAPQGPVRYPCAGFHGYERRNSCPCGFGH